MDGEPYKGSKALFGRYKPPKCPFVTNGVSVLDPRMVKAFVELHIEQGPVLEGMGAPIGVVTGIMGNARRRIRCRGEAGHSGTTPREARKDAVFASARLVTAIEDFATTVANCSSTTCGELFTDAARHGMTRVPDLVEMTAECRSADAGVLRYFDEWLDVKTGTNQRSGVSFETVKRSLSPLIALRPGLVCGTKYAPHLPSGAGHDAAVFAEAGIPAAMIFVRNSGGSHNPNEAMAIDDFMIGVDALEATLRSLY